jgi:hypothetical protein
LKGIEVVESVPSMLLIRKKPDSAVLPVTNVVFEEGLRRRFGEEKVDLRIISGGGHGLDKESTLEMPWLNGGLNKVTELWLGGAEIREYATVRGIK